MPKQSHILYISTQLEVESLAEVIEYEGFYVFKATTIEMARKILEEEKVHLILINIIMPDNENDYSDLKLLEDPLYNDVPKVVMMMDRQEPLHKRIKNIPALIYTSYQEEQNRLNKLLTAIKTHFNHLL